MRTTSWMSYGVVVIDYYAGRRGDEGGRGGGGSGRGGVYCSDAHPPRVLLLFLIAVTRRVNSLH